MSKLPRWFVLGVAAVGAAVAIALLLTAEKLVVEIPLTDRTMRPAIGDGTSFEVDASWLAKPSRGRVVAYVPPGKSGKPCAARAVAVEGDRLEVRGRRLYVNDVVDAKAGGAMPFDDVPKLVCPRDCVYVLVDTSRQGAMDSSQFGPLPLWRVLGAIAR